MRWTIIFVQYASHVHAVECEGDTPGAAAAYAREIYGLDYDFAAVAAFPGWGHGAKLMPRACWGSPENTFE